LVKLLYIIYKFKYMKHILIISFFSLFFSCNSNHILFKKGKLKIESASYSSKTLEQEQKYQLEILFEKYSKFNIKKIIFRKHFTSNFSIDKNTLNATIIINSNYLKKSEITTLNDGIVYEKNGKEYFIPLQFIYKK